MPIYCTSSALNSWLSCFTESVFKNVIMRFVLISVHLHILASAFKWRLITAIGLDTIGNRPSRVFIYLLPPPNLSNRHHVYCWGVVRPCTSRGSTDFVPATFVFPAAPKKLTIARSLDRQVPKKCNRKKKTIPRKKGLWSTPNIMATRKPLETMQYVSARRGARRWERNAKIQECTASNFTSWRNVWRYSVRSRV